MTSPDFTDSVIAWYRHELAKEKFAEIIQSRFKSPKELITFVTENNLPYARHPEPVPIDVATIWFNGTYKPEQKVGLYILAHIYPELWEFLVKDPNEVDKEETPPKTGIYLAVDNTKEAESIPFDPPF